MDATAVVGVIEVFERERIDVWLDGGWGVDALLGEQTRSHSDLDVIVRASDVTRIRRALAGLGYVEKPDGSARNFVLAHDEIGQVDVHAIDFDERGFGVFQLPGGGKWAFPPSAFEGKGRVADRGVRCLSAEAQVQCHAQGYVPTEKDFGDMEHLQERLGVLLPLQLTREARPVVVDRDKLIDILLKQRDEHISRVFAFNGQISILTVTVSLSILFGAISGTEKLAGLEFTERLPFWLMVTGLSTFALSLLFIGYVLIRHGMDRLSAADHNATAAAELIKGAEPALVLRELGKSMKPLLKDVVTPHLAIDVNRLEYRTTLYAKTAIACVLLLLSSILIALAIIAGQTAEKPGGFFFSLPL